MQDTCESTLYWEGIAQRRLGRYITDVERRVFDRGIALAGGPGTAIEIGCEGGRWSSILASTGWKLICTDVDPVALGACHRRLPDAKCVLVEKSGKTFPAASGAASLLLAVEVEPVTDSDWFADEAARVLKPGGILMTTFLNSTSVRSVIHKLLRHSSGKGAFYQRSFASKRKRLLDAGFDLLKQTGCCWIPFSRASDSPLIPFCARLEQLLGVRHFPSISPWVVVLAQKR